MTTLFLSQKHYKDSKNNVFCIDIDENNKDTWEQDVKKGWEEISKQEAELIANPPLTKEQLIEQAEQQKQALIIEASQKTQLWQTQLMLDIITEEDKASLKEWMLYVQQVQSVDPSLGAAVVWPTPPASPAR